jgi:flavorubredoxin
VKNISLYNVSTTHHSYILRDIFRFKGLIVGAPTYNNGLYHEMDVLLQEVATRDIKNPCIGWFGSFAWVGQAVKKIGEWNEKAIHFEPVGTPVEMKQALTADTRLQCEQLGKAMAQRLLSE